MTISFENYLLQKISKYKNKKLLIAYSGGKDSTALLHYFSINRQKYNIALVPVYINHNLRYDVSSDITHCKKFCKNIGLELYVESVNTLEHANNEKIGIEEAARVLRYKALYEIKNKTNCDYIVVAHNFNDQIENFFIKIFRGTSIFRLKGFNNINFIERPMLDIPVKEIMSYIERNQLAFINDYTNLDDNYLRNWVREHIVKNIELANSAFLEKIAQIQDESELLDKYMHERIKLPYSYINGIIKISKEQFLTLSDIERNYYLSQIIPLNITKNILKEINRILLANDSKRINLHGGYIFEKSMNYIYIFNKAKIANFEICKEVNCDTVNIDHLNKIIFFDDYLIREKLLLRNRKSGDRFFGKKVKDLFINKKIDLFERDTSIIVQDASGNILWVENICDNTKNIKLVSP
jgi:tRNA(Ile)-lysidine synthase